MRRSNHTTAFCTAARSAAAVAHRHGFRRRRKNRNRRVERRDRCAEFGRERGQRRGYQSSSDKGDSQTTKRQALAVSARWFPPVRQPHWSHAFKPKNPAKTIAAV